MVDSSNDVPSEGSDSGKDGDDAQEAAKKLRKEVERGPWETYREGAIHVWEQISGSIRGEEVPKNPHGSYVPSHETIQPKSQTSGQPQDKSDGSPAPVVAPAEKVIAKGQSQNERPAEGSRGEKPPDHTSPVPAAVSAAAGKDEPKAATNDAGAGGTAPVKSRSEVPGHHSQTEAPSPAPVGTAEKAQAAAKDARPASDSASPPEVRIQEPANGENRVAGGTASVSKLDMKSAAKDVGNIGLSPVHDPKVLSTGSRGSDARSDRGASVPAKEVGPAVTPRAKAEAETLVPQPRSVVPHDRQRSAAPSDQAALPRIAADSHGARQSSPPDSGVRQLTSHDLRLLQKAISSPMPEAILASNKDVPVGPSRPAESRPGDLRAPETRAVEPVRTKDVGRVIGAAKDAPSRSEAEGHARLAGRSDSLEKMGVPPSPGHRLDVTGKRADGAEKVGDSPGGGKAQGMTAAKGDAAPGAVGKGGRIVDPPTIFPPAGAKVGDIGLPGKQSAGRGGKDGDPRSVKDGKGNDAKGGRAGEPPIFLPPGAIRVGRFFPPDKEPTAGGGQAGKGADKGARTTETGGNADVGSQRAAGREPAGAAGKSAPSDSRDPRTNKDGKAIDSKGGRPPETPVVLPPGGIRVGTIFPPGREGGRKGVQPEPVSRQPADKTGQGSPGKSGADPKTSGAKPGAREVPVDKQGPIEVNADRFAGLPVVQGPALPWLGVRIADARSPQPPESGSRGPGRPEARGPQPNDLDGQVGGVRAPESRAAAAQSSDKASPAGPSLDEKAGTSELAAPGEEAQPVRLFRLPDLLITGPISKPKFRVRQDSAVAAPAPDSVAEPAEQVEDKESEPAPLDSGKTRGKLLGYDYSLLDEQDDKHEPMPGANYVVQPGDTLESIAAKVFADSLIAILLLEMNKSTVPTGLADGRLVIDLRAGTVITLPTLSKVRQFRERLASSTASIFDYLAQPDQSQPE